MSYDDFFKHRSRHLNHKPEPQFNEEPNDTCFYREGYRGNFKHQLFRVLKKNPKLKGVLIAGVILLLIVKVMVVVLMFPVVAKFLH